MASAWTAQNTGAHRIELCTDPGEGGTTASLGMIKTVRENIQIPLYPIIRPRGGNFLYSNEEFEIMLNDVALCRQLNCDGIVTGLLQSDGTVDKKRTAKLVELAYPLGVSFHRAFDWSIDPHEALEAIVETGCERILTSGQCPMAMQGAGLLKALIQQAANRIIIMPGSGLRAQNIIEMAEKTGAVEFHTSARVKLPNSMQYLNDAMQDDQQTVFADPSEIEAMLRSLDNYFSKQIINEQS
jgi:copper homeostasis protein